MKILIVSMRSIHTIRWVSQLKDSGHEIFYFDILNGGYIKQLDWVEQHTNWRYKLGDFKGRYFIKKYLPSLHKYLERDVAKEFELVLQKFKPDAVHSFVMYSCCVPIFEVMQAHKLIKWIYSAWGNDLFYYQQLPNYKADIEKVLPQIDYMFADCKRDLNLALKLGFEGKALGAFPGGGGYYLEHYKPYYKSIKNRNTILIKGYQQRFGKCSVVLEAINLIKEELSDYDIVVFGADKELMAYIAQNPIYDKIEIKTTMQHDEVLQLMGKALLYIGNSISDGMPNTLLEAIIMGAFPMQSNPGGATAEIIEDGNNGYLIHDPEDAEAIAQLIIAALRNTEQLNKALTINSEKANEIAFQSIREKVLMAYNKVEQNIQ